MRKALFIIIFAEEKTEAQRIEVTDLNSQI